MTASSVVEQSFDIAWGVLAKSEVVRPAVAANLLLESILTQIRMGEFRPLMLGNRAFEACRTRR
ncbi:hypothetical protein XH90_09900 [Bradyrhizobium sp. CCBAU 53338]|nr:hypothetical protein XH90_09900 [Bradyrhizobium sp. CCBAU 53338]